jgi:hypothetical protein
MSTETRYGSTGIGGLFGAPVTTTSQGSLTNNWAQVTANCFSDTTLDTGGVRYRAIGSSIGREDGVAYPFYQSFKTIPVVGEVVLLIPGPKPGGDLKSVSGDYYLPALNIWNNPQGGRSSIGNYLNQLKDGWEETVDNNALYPFPGDVIIEGRKGQSIRFSENLVQEQSDGSKTPLTPWISRQEKRHQSTVTIVSGITTTGDATNYVTENINTDASSIYLLQNQKVNLQAPHEWKREGLTSYGTLTLPSGSNSYTGNQILFNSDRLYLNARKEHILLSAQQHVGLLGFQVHLDAVNTINLAAPTVLLTAAARNPAIKGDQLITELENLYSRLAALTETLSDVVNSLNVGTDTVDELKDHLKGRIDNGNQKLKESLLSKTVYLS